MDNGSLVNSSFSSRAGGRSVFVGPLEPQLSYGVTCAVDTAPWLEITDAPGLVDGPHGGVFDGHRLS